MGTESALDSEDDWITTYRCHCAALARGDSVEAIMAEMFGRNAGAARGKGVEARGEQIDQLIEQASVNWRIPRMPTIDRNILRLASFELLACPDIPASVSINEAIELAKRFGDRESRAFVNGILDRIAAEVGRGGRHHRSR